MSDHRLAMLGEVHNESRTNARWVVMCGGGAMSADVSRESALADFEHHAQGVGHG